MMVTISILIIVVNAPLCLEIEVLFRETISTQTVENPVLHARMSKSNNRIFFRIIDIDFIFKDTAIHNFPIAVIDLTQDGDENEGIDCFPFSIQKNTYVYLETSQVQPVAVLPPDVIDLTQDSDEQEGISIHSPFKI